MGYVVEPSSGDMPEVPDGLYKATITAVKPIKLDQPDQFGKTEKLEIAVEFDVDGETMTLDPRVNRAWSEKATLFMIAQAAGLDPSPFEGFDTDLLVNREVNILTEQEEGKWPRIKAWSRVSTKKASQTAPQPNARPSVVNADGTANHDAFWRAVQSLGLNRSHVLEKVNGDIDAFTSMDGPEVAFLLEELRVQVEATA